MRCASLSAHTSGVSNKISQKKMQKHPLAYIIYIALCIYKTFFVAALYLADDHMLFAIHDVLAYAYATKK